MLVDAAPYAEAALAFERGNRGMALAFDHLSGRLMRCGAMAGDASVASEFAAAYDEAAAMALAAVGDLVDAFSTCGRLTSASLDNHGQAENRSVISGRTVFTGAPCGAGYVAVLPCTLPSSLGGDLGGIPGWAAWILDQVESFVWPDADTARLREAAGAWRAASHQVADHAAYCSTAIRSWTSLRSAELPIATSVAESLAARCRGVADQCAVIASACETYADQVEAQREEILDLVHDLLRDAVIIEGLGIVLGAFTAGGGLAGATALNAARIAAAAPRLLRILQTLRAMASACAVPMRAAAAALREVRASLAAFRGVRVTLASTYDAERLARVARLREIVKSHRLLNPQDLRGLSPEQIRDICRGWPVAPSKRGVGLVYDDVANGGRQIRVMEGYPPGSRPDPLTWGPYAEISQNGVPIKVPLEGNPTL